MVNWEMLAASSGVPRTSMLEKLLHSVDPEVISFGLGLPDSRLFPASCLRKAATRVLQSGSSLQYSAPNSELKAFVVDLMARRGVNCHTDDVLLTAGGQQGISLVVRALGRFRGCIVTESFTYPGLEQVVAALEPHRIRLRTHTPFAHLEEVLASGVRPDLVYLVPEGNNPSGTSMRVSDKRMLAALAAAHQIPIVEDDAYGFLQYDNEIRPPLLSFDSDRIFYIGTFSKIIAPALRCGWIVVPRAFRSTFASLKESFDINMVTLSQHILRELFREFPLNRHLEELRATYSVRRDALVSCLQQLAPDLVKFEVPRSGFFVWVTLPSVLDADLLLREAVAIYKIAFVPGSAFSGNLPIGRSNIRLCFAALDVAQIEEGVERLSSLLKAEL